MVTPEVVLGVTGLGEDDEKCIETICDSIPCVRSANMSIATNALYALLPHLVAALGGQYDIESVEAHHFN